MLNCGASFKDPSGIAYGRYVVSKIFRKIREAHLTKYGDSRVKLTES